MVIHNKSPVSLHSAAWSFILNGYSKDFLNKYANRIPQFVDIVVKNNTSVRLSNLINSSADQKRMLSFMIYTIRI